MLRLQPVNAVMVGADVPSIDRVAEEVGDALLDDLTLLVARKLRKGGAESGDFRLRSEAAGGVSFEGFTDDRGYRFVRKEHLAAPLNGPVDVSDRGVMNPVSILHAGFGLLDRLPRVLLPLELPLRRKDSLHELTFGRVVEPIV
ncbi:MAG: hypothetical protein AAGJ91_11530 [Pseudomonadota bacterium]